MNEPSNRIQIFLKTGVKTMPEKEATIVLKSTREKLDRHREELIGDMGKVRGNAYFQTHCGDLYDFIRDRILEGRMTITVRIIGCVKNGNKFFQFAFSENGKDYTCTVHRGCLRNIKRIHPSQFRYEPVAIPAVAVV
jgi:hypothetical protein